jgi:hypothetical protein
MIFTRKITSNIVKVTLDSRAPVVRRKVVESNMKAGESHNNPQ